MRRPTPRLTSGGSKEFYEGCRDGELRLQRCTACQRFRFPPQSMCPECNGTGIEYVCLPDARGHVVTFAIVPAPLKQTMPMGAWPMSEYPIAIVISEIEGADGARIVTNFPPDDVAALCVGLPVEYEFVTVDDVVLPRARPAASVQA